MVESRANSVDAGVNRAKAEPGPPNIESAMLSPARSPRAIFAGHNAPPSTMCHTADNCSNGTPITIRLDRAL